MSNLNEGYEKKQDSYFKSTVAHQWDFFVWVFFCHWTKFYCLGKRRRCKLRVKGAAQKTASSVTQIQAISDDGSLS